MKSRGINDRKLLWNFPLPILTSWDFFKWLKFGGHSWQEPVIGHFFLVHGLLTYGIYWCLKVIAWKKKHFHKSYSSFSLVSKFGVPYFNSSKQPIGPFWPQGFPLNVPDRLLEWDSHYLRSMEACLVNKIKLNYPFLQQIAVICTN